MVGHRVYLNGFFDKQHVHQLIETLDPTKIHKSIERNNYFAEIHRLAFPSFLQIAVSSILKEKCLSEFSNYFSWIYIFIGCYLVLSFCNGKTSDRDFNK